MASILGLEDLDSSLRSALQSLLRPSDEAFALPNMVHITPSGAKGVVFSINGDTPNVNVSIFGCGAFASGVAAMEIPEEAVTKILCNANQFKSSLINLNEAISSENANADLVIGPNLDTNGGKDVEAWKAGFDGTSCAVGIYSAHVPVGLAGRTRPSKQYFLVAKAGAGAAAATFHQRLMAQLKTGASMNVAMKTVGSFERVMSSAQRNRARLLASAAKALRIDHLLSTLTDVLSCSSDRALSALPTYDCCSNTLRQTPAGWLFHSGCIDGKLNSSVIIASNVSEGFVLFVAPETSANRKLSVRNDLGDAVPAGSRRRITNMELASQLRSRIIDDTDADYNARFAWSQPTAMSKFVPPPGLLGSHECEETSASWARELGLASLRRVVLSPELVTLASWRPSVLRSLQ
jgi:hypothetical protein